jgi:hypothetical protein
VAATVETAIPAKAALDQKLAKSPGLGGMIIFGLILAAGMFYAATHLISDLSVEHATTIRPFIMLAGALLIALGFELRTRWSHTSRSHGRGSATSPASCFRPAPWHSASCRCCRSS